MCEHEHVGVDEMSTLNKEQEYHSPSIVADCRLVLLFLLLTRVKK